jgi:hypothetical protein
MGEPPSCEKAGCEWGEREGREEGEERRERTNSGVVGDAACVGLVLHGVGEEVVL